MWMSSEGSWLHTSHITPVDSAIHLALRHNSMAQVCIDPVSGLCISKLHWETHIIFRQFIINLCVLLKWERENFHLICFLSVPLFCCPACKCRRENIPVHFQPVSTEPVTPREMLPSCGISWTTWHRNSLCTNRMWTPFSRNQWVNLSNSVHSLVD